MWPRPFPKLLQMFHLFFRDRFRRRDIKEGLRRGLECPVALTVLIEEGTSSATDCQTASSNLAQALRECPGGKAS